MSAIVRWLESNSANRDPFSFGGRRSAEPWPAILARREIARAAEGNASRTDLQHQPAH